MDKSNEDDDYEDDNDPKPDDEVANIGDRVPVPELGGSSFTRDRTETKKNLSKEAKSWLVLFWQERWWWSIDLMIIFDLYSFPVDLRGRRKIVGDDNAFSDYLGNMVQQLNTYKWYGTYIDHDYNDKAHI